MASLSYNDAEIELIKHAGFRISVAGKTIYIDPFKLENTGQADLILISHSHFDHFDMESITKIRNQATTCIAPQDCHDTLGKATALKPGQSASAHGIKITAHEAYNINKFRAPGQVFHPKGLGVGYMIEAKGLRIYHCGDTDNIAELSAVTGKVDLLLIPASGTYVMDPKEAAQAAEMIKPKVAIPMHYGAIVGSLKDGQNFKKFYNGEAKILI